MEEYRNRSDDGDDERHASVVDYRDQEGLIMQ